MKGVHGNRKSHLHIVEMMISWICALCYNYHTEIHRVLLAAETEIAAVSQVLSDQVLSLKRCGQQRTIEQVRDLVGLMAGFFANCRLITHDKDLKPGLQP